MLSEDNVQNGDMQTKDGQEPMEAICNGGADDSKMGWGLN